VHRAIVNRSLQRHVRFSAVLLLLQQLHPSANYTQSEILPAAVSHPHSDCDRQQERRRRRRQQQQHRWQLKALLTANRDCCCHPRQYLYALNIPLCVHLTTRVACPHVCPFTYVFAAAIRTQLMLSVSNRRQEAATHVEYDDVPRRTSRFEATRKLPYTHRLERISPMHQANNMTGAVLALGIYAHRLHIYQLI
jgi:hypothetical protein